MSKEMTIDGMTKEQIEDVYNKVEDIFTHLDNRFLNFMNVAYEEREFYQEVVLEALEKQLNSLEQHPQQGWIPVSEKVPSDGETVLIATVSGGVYVTTVVESLFTDNRIYVGGDCGDIYYTPIAWQPIEPFRPKEESK